MHDLFEKENTYELVMKPLRIVVMIIIQCIYFELSFYNVLVEIVLNCYYFYDICLYVDH
jgi:hypothetical protein